ncbi:YbhB/YbcL family Raf kinase inhibitor-like protein [Halomarina halobia]|uniref:YbhB/YbcL family Raf kinase inhibitor-like protein n=1 Tax=Halomarina halobia TaxID=3033386 RepID=A0ABD6AA12_9EURY|nr:YbhB/YbcL family Raf kinase inhibitor-like protein [Halomarina sp. PSR21]
MDRRGFLVGVGATASLLAGCMDDPDAAAVPGNETERERGAASDTVPPDLSYEVEGLGFDMTLPPRHTCEGANISPGINVTTVDDAIDTLALAFVDESTGEPYVHWLLWGLPPTISVLDPGIAPRPRVELEVDATGISETIVVTQGTNSAGSVGYTGPCPPAGDPVHTYLMTMYGLDGPVDAEPGATYDEFRRAIEGTVLSTTVYAVKGKR